MVDRQLAAAMDAIGTPASPRAAAGSARARAEDSIRATGWPPGEDLVAWATVHGRLAAVVTAVGGLADTARQLRSRNDSALQALQSALPLR